MMVECDLLSVFSFLQVFGNFPIFRKLNFKSIEEWMESSSATGGNFQHCLHLLLDRHPQNKSFMTKMLEFCNQYIEAGTFRARKLHDRNPPLKIRILLRLLERQLVVNKQLKRFLSCGSDRLRVKPIGRDKDGNLYWFFLDRSLSVRIYRLKIDENDKETWTLVAKDRETFEELTAKLEEQNPDGRDEVRCDAVDAIPAEPSDNSGDNAEKCREVSKQHVAVALPTGAAGCQDCCNKVSSTQGDVGPEHFLLFYHFNPSSLCPSCNHRKLVDHLEEKLLIYKESLEKLEAMMKRNTLLETTCHGEEQHQETTTSHCLESQPQTSASPKPLPDIMDLAVPGLPCEPTSSNLPIMTTYTNLSSPSDIEDNEAKDPSFELNADENLYDDDDDDIEVAEDSPANRKRDNTKNKMSSCKKDVRQNRRRSSNYIPQARSPRCHSAGKKQVISSLHQHRPPPVYQKNTPGKEIPTRVVKPTFKNARPLDHRLQADVTRLKLLVGSQAQHSAPWRPESKVGRGSRPVAAVPPTSNNVRYRTNVPASNGRSASNLDRLLGLSGGGRTIRVGNSTSFVGRSVAVTNKSSAGAVSFGHRKISKKSPACFDGYEDSGGYAEMEENDGYREYESYEDQEYYDDWEDCEEQVCYDGEDGGMWGWDDGNSGGSGGCNESYGDEYYEEEAEYYEDCLEDGSSDFAWEREVATPGNEDFQGIEIINSDEDDLDGELYGQDDQEEELHYLDVHANDLNDADVLPDGSREYDVEEEGRGRISCEGRREISEDDCFVVELIE